jgi:hypothetical protein
MRGYGGQPGDFSAGLVNSAPSMGLSRVDPAQFGSPEIHFRAVIG